MINYYELLHKKLNNYFQGKLTKIDLCSWAKLEYYNLLLGDFIIIEKLFIYNFLKTVSNFHSIPNDIKDEYPPSEEDIHKIKDILDGVKNITYSGEVMLKNIIYSRFYYEERLNIFIELRKYINKFLSDGYLPNESKKFILLFVKRNLPNIYTLIDIIESHIISMFCDSSILDDNFFDYSQRFSLYINRTNITQDGFYKELLKLLNCIIGYKSFRVCISYKSGTPSLSLLL